MTVKKHLQSSHQTNYKNLSTRWANLSTVVEKKKHQSSDKIMKEVCLITMLKEKTVTHLIVVGMMTMNKIKILIKSSIVKRINSMRLELVPCQFVSNSIKKVTLSSLFTMMMTRNLRRLNANSSEWARSILQNKSKVNPTKPTATTPRVKSLLNPCHSINQHKT